MDEKSAHETINEMYEKVKADGLTNIMDRFEAQGTRCHFCSTGTTCSLCSNGPCRSTKKAERGACGLDANGMAMRMMLIRNVMGATAYAYHGRTTARTLRATAEGKTPFTIKEPEKLRAIAERHGLPSDGAIEDVACAVADFMMEELNRPSYEPSRVLEHMAPAARQEKWAELGLTPGGPLHETMESSTRVMTNIDGNYVTMALAALRLGLSNNYGTQVLLEDVQDVLFGVPRPHETEVDLGVIDPDYVNIMPNGHEPFIGAAMIEVARRPEVQEKAREAGAKGIHVVGSIETGQELLQRFEVDDVFVGMTGNWITQEFALATGAVDLFAMDMNCSVPTLAEYEDRYNTTLVSVSKLVNIPGVDRHIDYVPEEAEEQALELIDLAIENFKGREDEEVHVPERRQRAMVGFSIESCLDAMGGTLDPLLDAIKAGDVKGVVALVSCTSLKNGPHDENTIQMAKELIERDILVLSAGCGNAALQVAGLTDTSAIEQAGPGLQKVCNALGVPPVLSFGTCTDTGRISTLVTAVADALGTDTSDLPIAVTAPEYMEQKATIDAMFAVAFGLYTHVSPVPPITGGEDLVRLVTEDVEDLTGGKIAVGDDPAEAADGIEQHIQSKREALGM